jgi:hypothetical protein
MQFVEIHLLAVQPMLTSRSQLKNGSNTHVIVKADVRDGQFRLVLKLISELILRMCVCILRNI